MIQEMCGCSCSWPHFLHLTSAQAAALLRRGRLLLVLDLDHTLLASARFAELDSDMDALLVSAAGGATDA
jgi:hypothetical protein